MPRDCSEDGIIWLGWASFNSGASTVGFKRFLQLPWLLGLRSQPQWVHRPRKTTAWAVLEYRHVGGASSVHFTESVQFGGFESSINEWWVYSGSNKETPVLQSNNLNGSVVKTRPELQTIDHDPSVATRALSPLRRDWCSRHKDVAELHSRLEWLLIGWLHMCLADYCWAPAGRRDLSTETYTQSVRSDLGRLPLWNYSNSR